MRAADLEVPSSLSAKSSQNSGSRPRITIELANDLGDSLHFLMGLKLKAGLAEWETGQAVGGSVQVERLSSLERDLLKDALAVVKRFKVLVRHQFHLEGA